MGNIFGDVKDTGFGSNTLIDNLYGLDHRKTGTILGTNIDRQGYVFMVRPQLNLSTSNIQNSEELRHLINPSPNSNGSVIRATLDPRLLSKNEIQCPLVDPLSAFIPIVTNNLKNLSGVPSLTNDVFASKPNKVGYAYNMIDSYTNGGKNYDINLIFDQTETSIGSEIFDIWFQYPSLVREGRINPYFDMFGINLELDYSTRIYIIVLDRTSKYVRRIFCTGATFIRNNDKGKFFDYDTTVIFNEASHTFTIRVSNIGAMFEEFWVIEPFNKTVKNFNPNINSYSRIPNEYLSNFNHQGYPLINQKTREIEWYVEPSLLEGFLNELKNIF